MKFAMEGKVFLGQNLIWMMILLGQIHGYNSCIVKERNALLELKKHVISQSFEEGLYFTLPTWTNDTKSDCCKWKGVNCNCTTGRAIGISTGTLLLKESSLLNLSLLHPFEDVRSLDFSGNEKTKSYQDALSLFSGLFDDVEGYKSLRKLKKLKILDFSFNKFNRSIFPFLNAATSLTTLILRANNMYGPFHVKELKDLTNLEMLDLSRNSFTGSIPITELSSLWKLKALDLSDNIFSSSRLKELKNLTNLEVLGFARNYIGGSIPLEVFCEMKNLQELYLGGNSFVSQLPLCLGHLKKLRVLDLSSNELSGNIPSSFSGLKSLEYLSLLGNNFTGQLSLNPLTNLSKLKVLKLSSTSDMVQVETESTQLPKFHLRVVVLPFCRLEKIPKFLVYQKNLRLVDLSSNRLSGNVPSWLLENNPGLEVLQLHNNSFTTFHMPTIVHKLQLLDFSANNISGDLLGNIGNMLPNLVHMNGSDNKFQGNLPSSMSEMKNISFLDLSHNSFSGEVPGSLFTGCFSLIYLRLSHNKFSGHILPRRTVLTSLTVLRMDNNLFKGKIGDGGLRLVNLSLIDMSNNLLTGAIPRWISDLSFLSILMMSNNHLVGMIPPSLLANPQLYFVDLSGNLLSGSLPSNVTSPGVSLFLNDNNLTGQIPSTMLEKAYVLDLQSNILSGSLPQFDNTGDLSILLIRANNLTGSIPSKLCHLSNIRLLDLSHNKLSGFIPSCLSNLSFGLRGEAYMMTGYATGISYPGGSYWEFYKSTFFIEKFDLDYTTDLNVEIKFVAKHRYDSYSGASESHGGTLDYMYGLDLSSNELSGVVPAELGDLSNLRSLNLSHNFLSSHIPDSYSKLKDIESLDISHNMLQGSIPHQLTNLTSLAVFDVSYNNLSGIIPRGRQFNTFDEDSYLGNLLLCGPPTNRSCEAEKITEEADNGEGEDGDEAVIDMLFFYWSTASTYVTVLTGVLVLMCFDCPWRRACLHFVDGFITSAKKGTK